MKKNYASDWSLSHLAQARLFEWGARFDHRGLEPVCVGKLRGAVVHWWVRRVVCCGGLDRCRHQFVDELFNVPYDLWVWQELSRDMPRRSRRKEVSL